MWVVCILSWDWAVWWYIGSFHFLLSEIAKCTRGPQRVIGG